MFSAENKKRRPKLKIVRFGHQNARAKCGVRSMPRIPNASMTRAPCKKLDCDPDHALIGVSRSACRDQFFRYQNETFQRFSVVSPLSMRNLTLQISEI